MGDQDHICHDLLQRYAVSQAILPEDLPAVQPHPRTLSQASWDLKHGAGLWREEAEASGQWSIINSTLWSSTDMTTEKGDRKGMSCLMTWPHFLSSAFTKLTCCPLFWIYQQAGNHNYCWWITAHSRENRSLQCQVWPSNTEASPLC